MKKILIIILVVAVIGGGAFYFYKNKMVAGDDTNIGAQSQQDMQAQREKMEEQQKVFFAENFVTMSKDDLAIGDNVMVMGAENSDGSVVATNVLIGDETQLEAVMSKMRKNTNGSDIASGDANNTRQYNAQMPSVSGGNRPDFQNMTDEEREQMRSQWSSANGGNVGGRQKTSGRTARGGGQARISGEVLSKDDTGITLKLSSGGSKLIFFSNDTKILKNK